MSGSLKKAFEQAAKGNYWSDADSLSGPGSNLFQTRIIRQEIPLLLKKYGVKKMLDAPCGDLFWMKEILPGIVENGTEYNGADIVADLVEKNRLLFKSPAIQFYNIDLATDPVPQVDLIFTRDCFIHLPYADILTVLKNYKASGSKYLLVSTYTKSARKNKDVDGFSLWGRMLNMYKFPFYFPEPLELIVEGCTEKVGEEEFPDKSLGLWKLSELNLSGIHFCIRLLFFYKSLLKFPKKILTRLKRF